MAEKFGKRVRITVGSPGTTGRQWTGGKVDELRITFDVTKSPSKGANKGAVSIFNLNQSSRGFCAGADQLTIEAGYGDELEVLFKGDIGHVESTKSGTDWETKIEGGDGRSALNAKVNKSFAPGANPKQIFRHLIKTAKKKGVVEGFISGDLNKVQDEYLNGFVASGTLGQSLGKLSDRSGLELSIQDGALQLLRPDETTNATAVLISPNTGLVGAAEVTKEGTKITSRLIPKAKPGTLVSVESRTLTGFFRVQTAQHKGDTHGSAWDTMIEAKTL